MWQSAVALRATRSVFTNDLVCSITGRTKSRHRIYDDTSWSASPRAAAPDCGLTIGDIKEILFLRDADRPVASKRLTEILRARLDFGGADRLDGKLPVPGSPM